MAALSVQAKRALDIPWPPCHEYLGSFLRKWICQFCKINRYKILTVRKYFVKEWFTGERIFYGCRGYRSNSRTLGTNETRNWFLTFERLKQRYFRHYRKHRVYSRKRFSPFMDENAEGDSLWCLIRETFKITVFNVASNYLRWSHDVILSFDAILYHFAILRPRIQYTDTRHRTNTCTHTHTHIHTTYTNIHW